jgi:HAD superfamily hydrolase (TIGR01484 family)
VSAVARLAPLASFPAEARRALAGVLADIDDTLTHEGRLPGASLVALERLRAAGLIVIPVTGRPAGWCDHIARMWPVDAVVGENGAFWFRYNAAGKRLEKHYVIGDAERAACAQHLERIAARILKEVPGSAIASDQAYREADLAIDFREDVPALPRESVDRIVAIMASEGLTAKVSSIHVNGWFGGYDKLSTTRLCLREGFGVDLDAEKDRWVFVGDSPNDAPMFGFFPHAVGVANVLDFSGRMDALPRYVTSSRGASGFAELAEVLLAA